MAMAVPSRTTTLAFWTGDGLMVLPGAGGRIVVGVVLVLLGGLRSLVDGLSGLACEVSGLVDGLPNLIDGHSALVDGLPNLVDGLSGLACEVPGRGCGRLLALGRGLPALGSAVAVLVGSTSLGGFSGGAAGHPASGFSSG